MVGRYPFPRAAFGLRIVARIGKENAGIC